MKNTCARIIKHVRVVQYCSKCNEQLANQYLITTQKPNFSIEDITSDVLENYQRATCRRHPKASIKLTYSIYHERSIEI